jgi:DNA repair ATPase RecN
MGFRVAKIMQRFGITEEQFEKFMTDIYNRCQRLEVSPDQIENYLKEIIKLSKIVFPSEIPNYLQTQKKEIENLQEINENLQQEKSTSNIQKTILEGN